MSNAKYICSNMLELIGEVQSRCMEVNELLISAGGTEMFEREDNTEFDLEDATKEMSISQLMQFNDDSCVLLQGFHDTLLGMILKLRGVK